MIALDRSYHDSTSAGEGAGITELPAFHTNFDAPGQVVVKSRRHVADVYRLRRVVARPQPARCTSRGTNLAVKPAAKK